MSDALTDITPETAPEDDPHGRHRGHLMDEETPEPAHGRHRKAE
ncbi:hypothetical protein [Streptacidiphilus jiangxiensis]|uniref:Uncharacterized protein n=1 Tax=Streptacidiphilus jiangxiensis TaxID=235985 RepID=A0A1H7VWK6_STRJI|nr:hypothetical protein [Streptacidiphilus jiangxiensis]SEM13616.1 hypothetical protein SAMN05414137_11951 [Streptacidiphilus jiangxiensis]